LKQYGDLPKKLQILRLQVVIVPVPYDGTSTWLKGADKGPQALLEASAKHGGFTMFETDSEVHKVGNSYHAIGFSKMQP
jgi:agmatinase